MDDADEGAQLAEGMPVENSEGKPLGSLAALLVEEGQEDAEFLLLRTTEADRLVPMEAVLGVDEATLVLDVPVENLGRFPRLAPDADPTDEQMEQAYEAFDEGAGDWAGDEEDEDDED